MLNTTVTSFDSDYILGRCAVSVVCSVSLPNSEDLANKLSGDMYRGLPFFDITYLLWYYHILMGASYQKPKFYKITTPYLYFVQVVFTI